MELQQALRSDQEWESHPWQLQKPPDVKIFRRKKEVKQFNWPKHVSSDRPLSPWLNMNLWHSEPNISVDSCEYIHHLISELRSLTVGLLMNQPWYQWERRESSVLLLHWGTWKENYEPSELTMMEDEKVIAENAVGGLRRQRDDALWAIITFVLLQSFFPKTKTEMKPFRVGSADWRRTARNTYSRTGMEVSYWVEILEGTVDCGITWKIWRNLLGMRADTL